MKSAALSFENLYKGRFKIVKNIANKIVTISKEILEIPYIIATSTIIFFLQN